MPGWQTASVLVKACIFDAGSNGAQPHLRTPGVMELPAARWLKPDCHSRAAAGDPAALPQLQNRVRKHLPAAGVPENDEGEGGRGKGVRPHIGLNCEAARSAARVDVLPARENAIVPTGQALKELRQGMDGVGFEFIYP